jgi:hypothetical protein
MQRLVTFCCQQQKRIMKRPFLFLLAITLVAAGCSKEHSATEKYITLSYKLTYCSDPWQRGATDDQTLQNVGAYLNTAALYVAGLTIKEDTNPEVCNACSCKTGKTIYVTTLDSESLKEKYLQIGFKP